MPAYARSFTLGLSILCALWGSPTGAEEAKDGPESLLPEIRRAFEKRAASAQRLRMVWTEEKTYH